MYGKDNSLHTEHTMALVSQLTALNGESDCLLGEQYPKEAGQVSFTASSEFLAQERLYNFPWPLLFRSC